MSEQDLEEIRFNNRRLIPFLTVLALFLGLIVGGFSVYILNLFFNSSNNQNYRSELVLKNYNYYDQEYIKSIVDILNSKYLGSLNELSKESITYGIAKGLISSLNDQYTNFFTPEEAEEYFEQVSGDFEGVGISLAFNGAFTYVETVLKGQPAEEAGVLPGDIILSVDGEDVEDKLPALVANKIRGKKGTDVVLIVYRNSEKASEQKEEIKIKITRDSIEVDNVSWKKHDENTVIIDIIQFSDSSAETFNKTWDRIKSQIQQDMPSLQNIIVDLRSNPGGYVLSVRHVLEDFLLNDQIIMRERSKTQKEKVYKDNRDGLFEEEKIVVLVNEGSASASEIFASAIQDHQRGIVIGEKTVGKGVEQEMVELSDGSLILLVFQEWLTPNGRVITAEEPIIPDYEVEYNLENFKNNTDPQLDRALELL